VALSLGDGDLLDQKRRGNCQRMESQYHPWWLLLPGGVSGAIKRRGGIQPFRELARLGPMPLGSARITGLASCPLRPSFTLRG